MPDETSYPMSSLSICFGMGYHSSRERKLDEENARVSTLKFVRMQHTNVDYLPLVRTFVSVSRKGFLSRGTLYTNRTYIGAHFFVDQVYPRGLRPCIIL